MLLAATFILTTSVSQVHATDGKNYPGSMCIRVTGGGGIPTISDGGIGNASSTSTMRLECPAIKDQAFNIDSGWVLVYDRHFSQAVKCSLHSRSPIYASISPVVSSVGGSATGPSETLRFGWRGGLSISRYFYSCEIPPAFNGAISYLVSYHVEEQE